MGEQELFARLSDLYEEQRQIYSQILDLSRRQGDMVRRGACLTEIRQVLEKKNICLEIIKRSECTERTAKNLWEQGKARWSAHNQEHLNAALHGVSSLIEEILVCEERNDQAFIQQMRALS